MKIELIVPLLILTAITICTIGSITIAHEFEYAVFSAYISCYMAIIPIIFTKYRKYPLLYIVAFSVGLVFEVIGVHTGIPFGSYEYVMLGPFRVLDVPISIPIMWGIYSMLTYLTARTWFKGWKLVVYASILMVLIDLVLDPLMTSWKAWVWKGGWGPTIYGIPLSNYIGWFIVSLTIMTIYEQIIKGDAPRITVMPLIYLYEVTFYSMYAPKDIALITTILAYSSIIAPTLYPMQKQHS